MAACRSQHVQRQQRRPKRAERQTNLQNGREREGCTRDAEDVCLVEVCASRGGLRQTRYDRDSGLYKPEQHDGHDVEIEGHSAQRVRGR